MYNKKGTMNRFNTKLFIMCICLALCTMSGMFAEDTATTQITGAMSNLVGFITSPWIRGLALVALIILIISMFITKEQDHIKKFIPWIAACILFMSAGGIVNKMLNFKTGFSLSDNGTTITEAQ